MGWFFKKRKKKEPAPVMEKVEKQEKSEYHIPTPEQPARMTEEQARQFAKALSRFMKEDQDDS